VLHLRSGISLRVDVADFLELERSLERDGEVVPPTEVQEIRRALVLLGDLLQFNAKDASISSDENCNL
jgi:hypothetical protein